MDRTSDDVTKDPRALGHHEAMTAQEYDRLRRYIAVKVVGDSPPPLTAEAQDLIRVMLGSDYAGESAAA